MKSSQPHQLVLATVTCLLLALAGTGCSSLSGPGSASFASVTIQNHSAEEIEAATAQVFGADGYQSRLPGGGEMVFDKEASRATSYAREGIYNAQEGAQTINRVRVQLVPLSGGQYRLQCKAFMVTGGSLQDEVPVAHFRSGPYQSLLKQVQQQLK